MLRQTPVQVQCEKVEVPLLIKDMCEVDTLDVMPLLRSLCSFGTNLRVSGLASFSELISNSLRGILHTK